MQSGSAASTAAASCRLRALSSQADHALVRSIATEMKLLEGLDRMRVLDSLALIELVAALEDATGLDLLRLPLTVEMFRTVDSITDLLGRARTEAS